MLKIRSDVHVQDATGKEVFNFMLNCTDEDYQAWWPGTHLAWHSLKRTQDNLGNLVYFDEFVGKRRLQFKGLVTEIIPGKKIVWQMIKGIKLPAWLGLELQDQPEGLHITHTLSIGYQGIGKFLDPVLRLYFSDAFVHELDQHAQTEFPLLGELLISRRKDSL